jgi:hypothetical protein
VISRFMHVAVSFCFVSVAALSQDSGALRSVIVAVEGRVHQRASPAAAPASQSLGRVAQLVTLALTAGPGEVKPANVTPPGPVPIAHDNIPPNGHCDVPLPVGKSWAPANCNDTASSIEIPFGYQVTACEHDGRPPQGFGECRSYAPGFPNLQGTGFGDKATFFEVTDKMAVYLSSADDEVPAALQGGVTYTEQDGQGKVRIKLVIDQGYYTKDYSVELPQGCKIQVWETTKTGDSDWTHSVQNGRLNIRMRVKPRLPGGGNNWVGVGFRCS